MGDSLWHTQLGRFQENVAAPVPVPAGVATACVVGALGLSLLVKVLRISGKREDLVAPALALIEELKATADADAVAVHAYLQHRDTTGLKEVPCQAAHAVAQALDLCVQAGPSISGLIAADVQAASAMLDGAAKAINTCIEANSA